jgi:hypothetical protein
MVRTIFDIYKDVLRELDGTSIPKVTVTSESDYLVLQPGTNDDIYQFYVDPAICGNINVKFQMTNFATAAGETPSGTGDGVYDPSDYVSSSSVLPYEMTTTNFYNSTQEKEIPASSTEDVCSVNISNIPFNYDHADILIQYTVKTDGEFDVTWDGDWTLSSQGAFPTNITPTSLLQSDNSDVDLDYIGTNTTLVQRFYIKAIPNMRSGSILPSSTLTMKVENNLATPVTLSNIIVKPSFLHYADSSADGTIGGSSSDFASSTYPSGDTCYYVKTNGQIIAKISEALSTFNPTMTSVTGHYRGTVGEDPEGYKSVELVQTSDSKYIFTQSSSSAYLTPTEVTLWRGWVVDPQNSYYFGPLPFLSYTEALKQITALKIEFTGTGDNTVTLSVYYSPFAISQYRWQELNNYSSWEWAIKEDFGHPSFLKFTLYGVELYSDYDSFPPNTLSWSRLISQFPVTAQNSLNTKTPAQIANDIVISHNSAYGEQNVTQNYYSNNCGKTSNWDDSYTPPLDPDTDPDVFPTAPEGPSYMQYLLNDDANWITIDSNTSLTYIEKTDTGTDPEDYDGTIDQFYIGYKNLNSISYYAPATIAVNCIISYEQFKDTYVYGDYY